MGLYYSINIDNVKTGWYYMDVTASGTPGQIIGKINPPQWNPLDPYDCILYNFFIPNPLMQPEPISITLDADFYRG